MQTWSPADAAHPGAARRCGVPAGHAGALGAIRPLRGAAPDGFAV